MIKVKDTVAEPLVYIPVFPGTNSEYDSAKAFEAAGAKVNLVPFVTLDEAAIVKSVDTMVDNVDKANIIFFAGGFSAADEQMGQLSLSSTSCSTRRLRKPLMLSSVAAVSSLVSVMDSRL